MEYLITLLPYIEQYFIIALCFWAVMVFMSGYSQQDHTFYDFMFALIWPISLLHLFSMIIGSLFKRIGRFFRTGY